MSGLDAAFLAIEDTSIPQHLGNLSVFAPGPDGPLSYDVVLALVHSRLGAMPSARRVAVDAPFRIARPSWAPAAQFDLEFHVRHSAIPAGGGLSSLARLVAGIHALGLDRSRPLWELWVIDGMPDGRVAIYTKVHMAAVDPVSGVEPLTALLDTRGARPIPVDEPPDGAGSPALVDRVLGLLPDRPRRAAGFPWRLATA